VQVILTVPIKWSRMTREFDPKYPLAYCTNVHAGTGFAEMFANLTAFVPRVQDYRSRRGPMGIGLWFSNQSVVEARQAGNLKRLRDWLEVSLLVPFTANAFPQGDFHQAIVKYDVYQPDWSTAARLEYTLAVVRLMDELAPRDCELSVSTLPLGWTTPATDDSFLRKCAQNLLAVCRELESMEQSGGRLAYLCLEPEPGCILDSSEDVVGFFERWLLADQNQSAAVRRYLRVCHDVCHSAVMFEAQTAAIDRFQRAGIEIGKVQISAAVEANFVDLGTADRQKILTALHQFQEPRYLHQTNVQRPRGDATLFDDLSQAFAVVPDPISTCWRVHFHVPIFLSDLGPLRTTNYEIEQFLRAVVGLKMPQHFEVETYAWNVMPPSHAPNDLAAGIAAELDWVSELYRGM
jgi:hypothetical protein